VPDIFAAVVYPDESCEGDRAAPGPGRKETPGCRRGFSPPAQLQRPPQILGDGLRQRRDPPYYARNYEQALGLANTVVDRWPDDPVAWFVAADSLRCMARLDDAASS
jgi:hypothetical protein